MRAACLLQLTAVGLVPPLKDLKQVLIRLVLGLCVAATVADNGHYQALLDTYMVSTLFLAESSHWSFPCLSSCTK
jgi:hypothetical protein